MLKQLAQVAVVGLGVMVAACTVTPIQCPTVPGQPFKALNIETLLQDWDGAKALYEPHTNTIIVGFSKAASGGAQASGIWVDQVACTGEQRPPLKISTMLAQGRKPAIALGSGSVLLTWSTFQNLTNTSGGTGGTKPILSTAVARSLYLSSYLASGTSETAIAVTLAGLPFAGDVQVHDLAGRTDGSFIMAASRSVDGMCSEPFFQELSGLGSALHSTAMKPTDIAPTDSSGCVMDAVNASVGLDRRVFLGWSQATPDGLGGFGPSSVLYAPWTSTKLVMDSATAVATGNLVSFSMASGLSATGTPEAGQYIAVVSHQGTMTPDAGSPDAGTPVMDGGSTDAGILGLDAGTTDAGTTDAGTTDAGTTDAGSTDAGTTDAGTTDAGTTDAGTTDAGTTDAGTTDAGTTDAGTTGTGSTMDTILVQNMSLSSPTPLTISTSTGVNTRPVVAGADAGGAVAWTSTAADGTTSMIAQQFSDDGQTLAATGTTLDVSALAAVKTGRVESLAHLTGKSYFIVWSDLVSSVPSSPRNLHGAFITFP
jgi:hypothetical protein